MAAPAGLGHHDVVVGRQRLLDDDLGAGVTEDADGFTTRRIFKPPIVGPAHCQADAFDNGKPRGTS